jgi:hypothetical protein
MARAKDMGFRTDMPLYHGSGADFTAFRAVPTTAKGMETPGVSLALDPALASSFALDSELANPQVYKVFHRAEKPAQLRLDGRESHGAVVATLRDAFEAGHDAVMLRNYIKPGTPTKQDIVIVRDANQLRSPNAAFDPAKKNSSGLLAAAVGAPSAGVIGAAVSDPSAPFSFAP